MVDRKPTERAKYIAAFFANVDWHACERRVLRYDEDARRAAAL